MKSFKYIGPFDAAEVPALGVVVERGEVVDVEDTEISASFSDQPDNWEHIPDPKRSAAAKKAAAESSD